MKSIREILFEHLLCEAINKDDCEQLAQALEAEYIHKDSIRYLSERAVASFLFSHTFNFHGKIPLVYTRKAKAICSLAIKEEE